MRIVFPTFKAALFGAALLSIPIIPASSTEALPAAGPRVQLVGSAPSSQTDPDLKRPLAWLIAAQNPDGSWGEEARSQHPDVATTAVAGIALLRLGHTGSRGEFQASTRRALEYVVSAVERAPAEQVAVQGPGTLPQRKLGHNIDTYVAAQFLAEALPTLPGELRSPHRARPSRRWQLRQGWLGPAALQCVCSQRATRRRGRRRPRGRQQARPCRRQPDGQIPRRNEELRQSRKRRRGPLFRCGKRDRCGARA